MYACGPTVYNPPHIGNARAAVVYDLLYRVLMRHYDNVVYAPHIYTGGFSDTPITRNAFETAMHFVETPGAER